MTAPEMTAAVNAQRGMVETLFNRLRADGVANLGVTRDPYGAGEERAHVSATEAARALGLEVSRDAAANTYFTWPGRDRAAARVMIGSHLDSVPNGGNFDGAAGVVAGLAAIAALQAGGKRPERDVTVMAIRAEESIWFQVSYIGSRAALGTLPDGALDVRRIDTGKTLAEHIAACGGDPAALARRTRHIDPAGLKAFVEVHIEQAPSLVDAGLPVGICTGIPGNVRYPDAHILGSDDHVGLPRRFRRDAGLAGAEFHLALDALWREHETRGIGMACTIGRFHTDAARHGLTVVPGLFHFSLDLRAYDAAVLAALEARMLEIVRGIEARRGVRFELGPRASAAPGNVDAAIARALEGAAREQGVPTLQLGSPASHDAAAFAAAGVPMGMLFVRNENGSHNPREAMETDDFLAATRVLAAWLAEAAGVA
jgi:N-carbamoyl-L-amino-acid hydrolase